MKLSRVISFSSNFSCKQYQKTVPSNISQPKYILEYTFRRHNHDKENNIFDYNNQQLDNLRPKTDFKY